MPAQPDSDAPAGHRPGVDLRGGPAKLGAGSRRIYEQIRQVAEFQNRDREMEIEIAMVSAKIASGAIA